MFMQVFIECRRRLHHQQSYVKYFREIFQQSGVEGRAVGASLHRSVQGALPFRFPNLKESEPVKAPLRGTFGLPAKESFHGVLICLF